MTEANSSPQERRITFCLYESWEKIVEDSRLPPLKKLKRDELEPFKKNMVLLDLREDKDAPTFQVIGQNLEEDLDQSLVGLRISDVPRRSMLSRVTDHYLEVLRNRVPIAFEAEFVNNGDEKALYRGILLPFSDDGENINFILAGVRWILESELAEAEDQPSVEDLMSIIAAGHDQTKDDAVEDTPTEEEIEEEFVEIEETAPFEDEIIDELTSLADDIVFDEELEENEDITEGGDTEANLIHQPSQTEKVDALGHKLHLGYSDYPIERHVELEEVPREDIDNKDEMVEDAIQEQKVIETEPPETEDAKASPENKLPSELKKYHKKIVKFIKKEDSHHNRSRDSLYNILTAIYDFYHKCEASQDEYHALVSASGLKIQERAPFTPILKICLGKNYDKTRLTEYAAALSIAKHMDISIDDFHDFIKNFPGGIKGCVKEMRAIRKGTSTLNAEHRAPSAEEARDILKELAPIDQIRLKKVIVSKNADEFCLMVGKRYGNKIDILKILDDSHGKIDPILKRAAFLKGNLKK